MSDRISCRVARLRWRRGLPHIQQEQTVGFCQVICALKSRKSNTSRQSEIPTRLCPRRSVQRCLAENSPVIMSQWRSSGLDLSRAARRRARWSRRSRIRLRSPRGGSWAFFAIGRHPERPCGPCSGMEPPLQGTVLMGGRIIMVETSWNQRTSSASKYTSISQFTSRDAHQASFHLAPDDAGGGCAKSSPQPVSPPQ